MPKILESEALALAQNIDTLSDAEKPLALDILKRYQEQQWDNGEPEWPTQARAQKEGDARFRSMFEDLKNVDKAAPSLADALQYSDNPDADRARVASIAYLSRVNDKPADEIGSSLDLYRNDYTTRRGQKSTDDLGFYKLAAAEVAAMKLKEDTALEGEKAALRGEDVIASLQAWQSKNLDRIPDSTEFTKGYLKAKEGAGDYLPIADELLKLMESGTGKSTRPFDSAAANRLDEIAGELATMKPRERKQVYASISARAEAAGYEQKGFWSQMLGELDKGLYRMSSTLGTQAGIASDVASNIPALLAEGMMGNRDFGMTPSEVANTDASIAKRQALGEMQSELAAIVAGEIDPVRPTLGWLNDTVETGLIKGPGAVMPFMAATAALGPWGGGMLFTADFAEQNRRDLRAMGMDNDKAMEIGVIAAPLQAAVESLSNMVQLGGFTKLQTVLAGFTKPIGGGAGLAVRYVQNAVISFATEFTEEQLQDNFIVPAVQEIVGALAADVPEVDWSFFKTRAAESTPELLSVLAPMALVFGGVMTNAQANLSRDMTGNIDALKALNYSEAQAVEVVSEKTEDARIAKARSLWASRAGDKITLDSGAKNLAERMRQLSGDAMAQQRELERRGKLPILRPMADGKWLMTIPSDGSAATFDSHQEADKARWTWTEDQLGKVHALTRETLASMEKNLNVGREVAVEFFPDIRTAQDAVNEGASVEQIKNRVEQGKALGDISPDTSFEDAQTIDKATTEADGFLSSLRILGSSKNEFKDGILRTTIKLWEGSNILTLVEEKLEGDAKAIIMEPKGREWMLSRLRSYEQASGDKLFRELPDEQLKNEDIVEAWSHLGQSYLVGRSTFGEPLQKKAMRRFGRLLMRSGLTGAMNAESSFFAAVASRAQKLSELKQAGKLSDDLVSELEKQLGIDSQVSHDAAAAKEADAIASEAVDTSGYSPETPGPNGETFSTRAVPADASKVVQMPDGAQLVGPTTFSIRAYHGTPHKVDKFTTAKIGTGEGAQAYGYGLYFAENQSVARDYQNRLVANKPDSFAIITLDGVELPRKWSELLEVVTDADERDAIRGIQESGLSYTPTFGSDAKNKKVAAALEKLRGRVAIKQPAGNLYTVELLPDESEFLDWDKPLSEQSEKVKTALAPLFDSIEDKGTPRYKRITSGSIDGDSIYSVAILQHGSTQAASKYLASLGIPGIRYLDGMSRGAGDGTRNFVIFDENLVRILEENGKPVETFSTRAVPADASNVVQMPDGARLVGPTTFSIRAFHGTPHKVDRFRTDKIGTGEGAQAYGYGLYFAESKGVADQYRKVLVQKQKIGKSAPLTAKEDVQRIFLSVGNIEEVKNIVRAEIVAASSNLIEAQRNPNTSDFTEAEATRDLKRWQAALRYINDNYDDLRGNLYTVELMPDADEFLDWDKPLSEQSEKVRAALAPLFDSIEDKGTPRYKRITSGSIDGDSIYSVAILQHGSTQAASKYLASLGIPGIKYLDGNSRGDGNGTSNYVIFDESLVRILEENGKPVETFSLGKITPAQDAEYMAAVEAGDMEAAQRMVDAAAARAGYTVKAYHGTNANAYSDSDFTVFNTQGERGASFFSSRPEEAGNYGEKVYNVALLLKNPLIIDAKGKSWTDLVDAEVLSKPTEALEQKRQKFAGQAARMLRELGIEADETSPLRPIKTVEDLNASGTDTDALAKFARRYGYDGVVFRNVKDSPTAGIYKNEPQDSFAVFSPSQIKSADPVTRDESGKIVPLSQRFNPADNRITFSIRPGDFSARMEAKFSLFQAKPELRLAIAQVAKERVLQQSVKINEAIAKQDAATRALQEAETAFAEEMASLRADYEADEKAIRDERDTELKGVAADKGTELDRERIRRDADKKLARVRLEYERNQKEIEAKKAANDAKLNKSETAADREALKAIVRALDGALAVVPPVVRASVGGYFQAAKITTSAGMLKWAETRIDKLNVELEKYLKKQAVAEITKLFKKARPDMEAGKKGKGKDADMHALFAAAEAAADMDALAVAGRLADLDARIASGELTAEQEALAMTERGIVELVGDLKNADSGRAFSALDTLRDIYGGAWLKWKIAEIERKERRAGLRQDFIVATGKAGVRTERTKADKVNESLYGKGKAWLLNLSSMREVLAYAFGLDNERVTSLVDAERTASNTYEDANQPLGDEIEGLFTAMAGTRTKGERLRWNLSQRTIKTGKGELSQLEAIQALLMWRQEDGRRHMEGTRDESGKVTSSWSYDQAWIDEIEAALTPEARQVMSFIMGKYAAEWATLNPLYRARYGVNMPHHDAYAPITVTPVQTKAGEVVDPVTGSAVSGGSILTPGSLRTRSRNAIAEPDFRDALQTMILHSRQMEYWKAYYDLAVEMNAVLGNREVMNSVHAKGGKEAANALRQWIDVIGQGGFRDASLRLALFQAGSKLQGRAAGVALLGRMSAILSQSTQLAAAAVKMPVTSYLVRLAKLMTGGLGWRDAMRSDFIQRRFKTAPPIVRQAMDSLASAKPNEIQQLSRFFGNVLSGADAFFTSGTYAILLDYHREQGRAAGLTGAELDAYAHTEAERATEQVAQPTRTANRSLAELSNTGPLGKIGWAFASEARQKVALAAHAALNAKNDPVTAAKSAFLTFAIGGLFTQVLKNLLREAKGDDDREMWSLGRLGYAMTIAPLASAIPFGSAIAGDSNMLSNIQRAIQTLGNDEVDFRDVDAMLSAAGLFNDTAASLAQLSHLGLDLGKILSNAAD